MCFRNSQNLELEGTLGLLRAQLRARVFKSIDARADANQKQKHGFQWQNPAISKISEDPESKLMAYLIREYFEHYQMENTLSVYLPEVDMQDQPQAVPREHLAEKANIRIQKQPK